MDLTISLRNDLSVLNKQIDHLYKYETSETFDRLTDEEVGLFHEHFESILSAIDILDKRLNFYLDKEK